MVNKMKKYIVTLNDLGELIDDSGLVLYATGGSFLNLKEYEDKPKQDLPALIAAGMTSDDLIKLKSSGVI